MASLGGARDDGGMDDAARPPSPDAGPPRLSVRGLSSTLAGPFDLELGAGEAAAVSGPSGSGKSLFLRMLADLDPNSGEVALDGAPRGGMAAPAWRRRAPYVAAESGWWRDTVAEHFAPEHRAEAQALAGRFGLPDDLMEGPVLRLSTGERQRLAIIRALVLAPPLLLLDEPTAALDPEATAQVEAELRARLAGGMSLIVVTHDAAQADRLGARHYLMRERRMTLA